MRTFLQITSARARRGGARLRARLRSSDERGFLLVEVMMSALLVALIVTATFNGFDDANNLTLDQRRHSEAELLAAESQEQLRSDPATTLDALETAPHTYSREITNNGTSTTYNITQEAKALSAKGGTGCSATGSSKENGANIEILSSVTWALLEKTPKRPKVRVASIVTPPVGSALEVDVTDGGSPAKAESGVTAIVKFEPSGSKIATTVEGTTGAAGCVVFTGLATTKATVEIVEKPGWVIKTGELKPAPATVTIAPNITTQDPVVYAPGGKLTAQYTYKGASTWNGKAVRGDTFVVSNSGIPAGSSPYAVGATSVTIKESGEYPYLAQPATSISGYANQGAATATSSRYPTGDLFPFSSEWTAYAGDCPKNNVGAAAEGKAAVLAGESQTVKVPLSILNLSLKKGTWAGKGSATTDPGEYEVTIENPECEGYEPPNHSYGTSLEHKQKTKSGELENPFQPFGKQEICIYNASAKKAYRATYTNSTEAGNNLTIYTEQKSKAEREEAEKPAKELRENNEKAAKTAEEKREKEETEATTAKTRREKEEKELTEAKSTRESKEKSERETWKKYYEYRLISKTTLEKDEKEQTEKRAKEEAEEKTAKEKRTKEETEATTAKTKRTNEKAEAKKPKEEREAAEATATKEREKAEKEEKEFTTELKEPSVNWKVESGRTSC